MKKLFFLSLFLVLAFAAQAQLPEKFTEPIPLDTGEGASMEPNTNRILFFRHPGVPESEVNFQTTLSQIDYGFDQQITAIDLLGMPGFPVTGEVKLEATNVEQSLADPAGLCFENLLMNLVCDPEELARGDTNRPSWQLLVADLRNYHSAELRIAGLAPEVADVTLSGPPDAEPYNEFGLAGLVGNFVWGIYADHPSYPAICYDVAYAEDWIACPVFGKIYVQTSHSHEIAWPDPEYRQILELHSPIMLFRMSSNSRYHFAGYLANPLWPIHYESHDQDNPEPQVRKGNADFPMAIAAGNFASVEDGAIGAEGLSDIAVIGTATLPHAECLSMNELMVEEGLPSWPWGLACTRGIVWTRTLVGWSEPLRSTFDSAYLLPGAPKIYDMTGGREVTDKKSELFAAVNEPALDGSYYVLKYFDRGWIDHDEASELGRLVPPAYIRVVPPGENSDYGPFRIAAAKVNDDDFADFAITWKRTEDTLIDTEHQVWRGDYLPYFSLFFSRETEGVVEYDQFDFQVPNANQPLEVDPDAELAAIDFGSKEEQQYLVVGNNKRLASEDGSYHAYAYLFPIQGGVVENLNVKTVKMNFKGDEDDAATVGIGDITTHPSSFIMGAALRDPFLRAPESCNSTDVNNDHAVYGHLWLGPSYVGREEFHTLDFDHDGVPNRCECSEPLTGTNDEDQDEFPDDSECDRCPGQPDLDLEFDGIADACDNCPTERCADYSSEFDPQDCINFSQADGDGDGVGNSCDGCPENPARTLRGVYFFGPPSEECMSYLINCLGEPYVYCSGCANAFVAHQDMTYSRGDVEAEVEAGDVVWGSGVSSCEQGDDTDGDSISDAYDNCLNVTNTAQTDSDRDGSGDACDCDGGGQLDDCDNDGVPNRFENCPFDANPYQNDADSDGTGDECDNFPFDATRAHLQKPMPDTVYDPYAGYIADRRDLKLAQAFGILEEVRESLRNALENIGESLSQQQVCGYPDNTYPGPRPCHHMGRSGKEVTVILPSKTETPPPEPCVVGVDPACTPTDEPPPTEEEGPATGRNVSQYCIATVGRQNPKTAAIFDWEQAQVINANNEAQKITGIENFDIFVGAEGGIIHWECAFLAGAFTSTSVAQATEILPETSGAIAPYFVVQTSGLPPIPYGRRPDPQLAIAPPKALLLAPLTGASSEGGAALSLSPSLSQALAGRQLQQLPSGGVQFGIERENIHNKMVVKVLTSQSDFVAEGTRLAVGDLHSLISVDMKAPPEPWTFQPVEQRLDKLELPLRALEDKVALWRRMGRAITPEIYRELPWQTGMYAEFLVGQSTVTEAVVEANKSLSPDEQPMPEDYLHQVFLPAYVKAPRFGVGGGCGCHIEKESFSVAWLLYLLCLIAPVPVLMYYRRRNK